MSTLPISLDHDGVDVEVIDDALHITLADGRELSAPAEWFPRLRDATTAERRDWRLIGGGEGVHWPHIDADIAVRTLLRMA